MKNLFSGCGVVIDPLVSVRVTQFFGSLCSVCCEAQVRAIVAGRFSDF